ncbi:hypothetical protein EV421DRAFT_1911277 [Armillaria borealis]|uniref:Chromatin elongation factor spt5 n=1 Tax=Armillaria borealis TaxID=47425 RepID=A0AA39IX28_9AGAR|nr:hypothetical protein EV421DRAFT_1911277 [Armillaria borealis]
MAVSTSPKALSKRNMFVAVEAEEDLSSDEDILAGELEVPQTSMMILTAARPPSKLKHIRSVKISMMKNMNNGWQASLTDNLEVFYWRIGIYGGSLQLGEEEFIVVTLFANAKPELPIHSVFLPPIACRWVYLEANMSVELQALLRSIRGVIQIHGSGALEVLSIPWEEWIATLSWNRKVIKSTVGTWVCLTSGMLKGAVGVVSGSYTWHVTVVVVPCIHYNPDSYVIVNNDKKRKPGPPPPSISLMWPVSKPSMDSLPSNNTSDCAKPASSASNIAHTISSEMAVAKKTMPHAEEWHFYNEEELLVLSSQAEGRIWETTTNTVEVKYSNHSGLHTVSYTDVQKIFRVGDYMEIQAGSYVGRSGWVQYVEYVGEPSVDILEQTYCKDEGLQINIGESHLSAHVNMTKKMQHPVFHPQPTGSLDRLSFEVHSGPIPWKDVCVLVTKAGYQCCAQTGRVTDMLLHQPTASGLRIQIMFDHCFAETPMAMETFDYDDIVKSILTLPLLAYLPLQYPQHVFQPPERYKDVQL